MRNRNKDAQLRRFIITSARVFEWVARQFQDG